MTSGTVRNETSARVSVPSIVVPSGEGGKQVWRTDLLATEPYWLGGLYCGRANDRMVHGPEPEVPRRAVCALPLSRGAGPPGPRPHGRADVRPSYELADSRQGKFQQEVMLDVGHYLHEVITVVCTADGRTTRPHSPPRSSRSGGATRRCWCSRPRLGPGGRARRSSMSGSSRGR